MTFTLLELAQCAEREVQMRARVYPRFVMSGKLTSEKADREKAMMEEIARRLREEANAYNDGLADLFESSEDGAFGTSIKTG
jgi:hypothetical protein